MSDQAFGEDIDARKDLAGAINALYAEVRALRAEREERRLNATEAATALGFEPRFFHGRPWRVPGFGLQGNMHSLSTWRKWMAIPEAKRRSDWDAMPLEERRLARGIA